jgi:predicted enzyme related to lactoylglutathione lyase
MEEHEKINYVEFPAKDIEATKNFFKMATNLRFGQI